MAEQKQARLISEQDAAEYCGVGVSVFLTEFPYPPIRLRGRKLFDLKIIDQWLDGLSGIKSDEPPESEGDAYEQRQKRKRRAA